MRIETDEGIVGYGESSPMGAPVVSNAVRHLGRMIVGEDPFNVEALWMRMFSRNIININTYKTLHGGV